MQTPFPPADSVASLRRCGLGVLVAGRRRGRERGKGREGKGGMGGGGGECEAPTSGPPAYHMRGKRAG